jgi:hypothetical protein
MNPTGPTLPSVDVSIYRASEIDVVKKILARPGLLLFPAWVAILIFEWRHLQRPLHLCWAAWAIGFHCGKWLQVALDAKP